MFPIFMYFVFDFYTFENFGICGIKLKTKEYSLICNCLKNLPILKTVAYGG